jgi:hypothetical protein
MHVSDPRRTYNLARMNGSNADIAALKNGVEIRNTACPIGLIGAEIRGKVRQREFHLGNVSSIFDAAQAKCTMTLQRGDVF